VPAKARDRGPPHAARRLDRDGQLESDDQGGPLDRYGPLPETRPLDPDGQRDRGGQIDRCERRAHVAVLRMQMGRAWKRPVSACGTTI
jgi:hypothetical protein